jgi:hypothetical protein
MMVQVQPLEMHMVQKQVPMIVSVPPPEIHTGTEAGANGSVGAATGDAHGAEAGAPAPTAYITYIELPDPAKSSYY